MNKHEADTVTEYVDLTERLVSAMAHRIKTLEQRTDAAIAHIDRARRLAPDILRHDDGSIDAHLVAAIDVLRGEATA